MASYFVTLRAMLGVVSSDVTARAAGSAILRPGANALTSRILETATALFSAVLLILSFPGFELWPLAWVGLTPLLYQIARRPHARSAFILGWFWGILFFYGSCYWLTYSMIRYGHINARISYALLLIPVMLVALFPALCCLVLARLIARWGSIGLFAMPFVWVSLEWARLGVTGQLWNAIGYSQAYHPTMIQSASWGGVYAVGFLVVLTNGAIAYFLAERTRNAFRLTTMIGLIIAVLIVIPAILFKPQSPLPDLLVVAVQPNVPMERVGSQKETDLLLARHIALSRSGLQELERNEPIDNGAGVHLNSLPRLVIWPESPMNFTYGNDAQLRDLVTGFATGNRTSLLLNSLELSPDGSGYNSALMVNEQGRLVAQYDKIRLMPFGEYVPLPRWVPGSSAIAPLVGGFAPGNRYALMPVGTTRAGVFICFESAFPSIASTFANEGAGVLINISNDGYLGPTPVMRQHLANAIFRAVENDRPVLRVTNTGLTAHISRHGKIKDLSGGFQPEVRTWAVSKVTERTFYTKYGDLFVVLCAVATLFALAATVITRKP
ncbi:MAG: apolipoprotein N-acyltransferase [Pyrinomonadaceae bacterium]